MSRRCITDNDDHSGYYGFWAIPLAENPCSVMLKIRVRVINPKSYIHETLQMAKSFEDDISRKSKTSSYFGFSITPCLKSMYCNAEISVWLITIKLYEIYSWNFTDG